MKPLPADVLAALEAGRTIEAIKLLRASEGIGLKEAKDAIDAHRAQARAWTVAPGEVPRRSGLVGWALAILAVLAIGFYLVRHAS